MNETKIQIANRKESVKQEMQGLLGKASESRRFAEDDVSFRTIFERK